MNNKKQFQEVKTELQKACNSVKYFNRDFFTEYLKAYKKAHENNEKKKPEFYNKDGIILRHEYDVIYASDFYNKNSCAYCSFLEIMANIPLTVKIA